MMKMTFTRLLLILAVLAGIGLCSQTVLAQAPGTTETYSGTTITGTQNTLAESLYLGPGTYTINGTWQINSKNVWIAPTATFTGAGKIVFNNPTAVGGASSPTLIDGNNGNFIDVNIEMNNLSHMILTDIADPGFGTTNPSGPLAAALKIGKDFSFTATDVSGNNGGHVVLNGNDFVFDPNATVSLYRQSRYVDTGNSIAGHMVKQFDATSAPFVFPVGYSNTNYPYEPARITASSGTFHVSVQDDVASISDESGFSADKPYIERTWHIYADAPTLATIDLQNDGGVGSNGWDETAPHCVIRWQGGTNWEYNAMAPGTPGYLTTDGTSSGSVRSVTTTVVGSATNTLSYYTKQPLDPMPVSLVSFTAKVQENHTVALAWTTSLETNNKGFIIERSKDLKRFEKVGEVSEVAPNSKALKNYSLTDQTPYTGTSYYRLTQIDLDGRTTVYPAISAVLRDTPYGVFPNPVVSDGRFTLRLDEPESATINFYSANGRLLYLQKIGIESGNLLLKTAGKLPAGIYLLTVEERGQTRQHRIVVE